MGDDPLGDPSQLFVLIAILNGLAIARLFERTCEYFSSRSRVELDWLVTGWGFLTFLSVVRDWWAYFSTPIQDFTFWTYLHLLARPVAIYVVAVLLTPELPGEGKLDLSAHYRKVHRWVFGLIGALFVEGQLLRLVGDHGELLTAGNLVRLLFLSLLVLVLATRSRWVHVFFFVASTVLYFAFAIVSS